MGNIFSRSGGLRVETAVASERISAFWISAHVRVSKLSTDQTWPKPYEDVSRGKTEKPRADQSHEKLAPRKCGLRSASSFMQRLEHEDRGRHGEDANNQNQWLEPRCV